MTDRAAGAAPAETCGPYLLLDKVGSGGMAEVFRAVRTGPQGFMRTFALKRIVPGFAAADDFVQMFCAEARLCALLNHPNIVQVHDFGVHEGTYYLVMEHLRGRTVLELIRELRVRRRFVPPAVAAYVARHVALGLAYAHGLRADTGKSLRLVHRDVTPSNIMVLRTGAVKLLDFGIAKAPAFATRQTEAGFVKGKFSYASPEQLRCLPLDGRSDVFALGVVLWELLTLRKLFPGETDYEIVQNAIKQPLVAPSHFNRTVPAALDAIVMRALSRDSESRPDAKELAAALGDFLRAESFLEDAVVDLLRDLWAGKSSQIVSLPAEGLTAAPAAKPATGLDGKASDAALVDVRGAVSVSFDRGPGPAPEEKSATPSAISPSPLVRVKRRLRGAAGLVVAAAVSVVAFASYQSLGEIGRFLAPAASPGGAAVGSAAAGQADEIQLELDSRPRGAVVRRAGQRVGVTPLTVRLPRGRTPVVLLLDLPGHEMLPYQVVPEQDAIVTVELRPAAKP